MFSLFACLGLIFINIAAGSTAHSHSVESSLATDVVTTVTVVTSTTIVKVPETTVTSDPVSVTSTSNIQRSVASSTTNWSLTASQTSISVFVSTPTPGTDSGVMTIQTSTPANANSTLEIQTSTTASDSGIVSFETLTTMVTVTSEDPDEEPSTKGPSTVVVTRTASKTTGTSASASSSTSPGLVSVADRIDGGSILGAAVAFGVLLIGY